MENHKRFTVILISIFIITSIIYTNFFVTKAFCNSDYKKEIIINEIVQFLKDKKVKLSDSKLESMATTVYEESRLYDLDYRLVLALIKVESNFRHNVTSRDGSWGLMQIKPSLAKFISKSTGLEFKSKKDLHEPDNNIKLGTYHISKLMEDFENIHAVLYAYNVGHKKARVRINKESKPNTPFTRRVLKEYQKNTAVLPEP
ncbi:MAG: lytic transglycosylase domain-containing protein [Proteobacteria bacterium]|nr:lytic transglycosylase domain-containing protein [Pseudomonadota bacterium]